MANPEHVLFPTRLDDSIFDAGWATDPKRRHIGDSRSWNDHGSSEAASERLLKDQNAEGSTDGQ